MREYLIQVVSTIAILVGLGLVVYELRQSRLIAETQTIQDYYDMVQTTRNSFWEDGTLEALEKSCKEEDLTIKDAIVLDGYFSELLSHVSRQVRLQRSGFSDNPLYAKYAAEAQFPRVFAHEAGIRYWKSNRTDYNEQIRGYGDEILERNQFASCEEKMNAIVGDN